MPTYAYRCTTCDHQFEQSQRFSDDPLRDCPVCDGLVRRVIQPVGIVFKGSGWYITDSRKAAADATAAAKPDGKADGKGDRKPDVAASAKGDGAESKATDKTSKSAAGATAGTGAKAAAD